MADSGKLWDYRTIQGKSIRILGYVEVNFNLFLIKKS